jgi:hypothetical protein
MKILLTHDGDTWEILSEGASRDGKTYCHLASTTRFREQRNGRNPVQIGDWIENERILSAAMQAEERQRNSGALNPWLGCGPDPRN